MQFVYIDESGLTGPYAIMVGVIANSSRMRLTKEHWSGLLAELSKIVGKEVLEFHSRDFYKGKKQWRKISGDLRMKIIEEIINWVEKRKHKIVYSVVDRQLFKDQKVNDERLMEVGSEWRLMALHISLLIQKHFQGIMVTKTKRKIEQKGASVLVFDNEFREQKKYTNFLLNPSEWMDEFYKKAKDQKSFDKIVDVPHFVDSTHVELIQLADLMCYILNASLEFKAGERVPKSKEEEQFIHNLTNKIMNLSICKVYRDKGRTKTEGLFYDLAPVKLLKAV